jgi:hypothetical protein
VSAAYFVPTPDHEALPDVPDVPGALRRATQVRNPADELDDSID